MWADADLNSGAVLAQLLAQLVPKLQGFLGVSEAGLKVSISCISEASGVVGLMITQSKTERDGPLVEVP